MLVALMLASAPACAGYAVVDLGLLPGGTISSAAGINAAGQVTGVGNSSLGTRAFLSNGGSLTDVGVLPKGGTFSLGTAINAMGVVVGDADTSGAVHAFVAITPGQLSDLGVKQGWTGSHATGINDNGIISGYGNLPGNVTHAFATDGSGNMSDLGVFLGGTNSRANGVNASGTVVGSADLAGGMYHAFRTRSDGTLQDLGGLGAVNNPTYGLAINASGEVVGYGGPTGAEHLVRSNGSGTLDDLGVLSGFASSRGNAVNGAGTIVGTATAASGSSAAFVYTDTAGLQNLNALLAPGTDWTLTSATGINDAGEITGTGTIDGQTHAYRLEVVPEPSSVALLAIGALGLAAWSGLRSRRGASG